MAKRKTFMDEWEVTDKPREKLIHKGVSTLSVTELLAVLLRSGVKGESVLQLARHILHDCDYKLNNLAKLTVKELVKKYKGIGNAKATGIIVAVELGRRRMHEAAEMARLVSSSFDAYNYIFPLLQDLEHEEFWGIFLNRANRALRCEKLSAGGMSSTVIDVRVLFRKALECKATAIVIAHNHPSASLCPSNYDKAITEKIKEGGSLLDIVLHDHIIIAGKSYYSFVDEGLL